MIENWKDVQIVPEFCDQGVDCYRLEGGHFLNEYYIVSEAETRKLMNHPEVVGYEVYASLVTATSQMMYYLKEKKKITSANILSILRGALNYPLEESCYKEHIRVHDISFMSSERVFENGEMTGLEIKYCKLATVPNSTLLIGDIIASGESMLDIAYELKMRGARNIFTCCTFPLFTAGLEKFDKAYNDGIIKAVLGTNLTYRKPELLEREWYFDVDVSKYTAYFIAAINHDKSVSSIIDPMTKIRTLLDKHGIPMGGEQ